MNNKARVGGVRSQKKKGAGWSRAEGYGSRGSAAAAACADPISCLPAASPKGPSGHGNGDQAEGRARDVLSKLVCVCFNTRIGN